MSSTLRREIKTFSPDLAGERVGWSSITRYDHEGEWISLRVDGGYATVGDVGASIHRYENDNGEVYSGTSLTDGLRNACAWNFYVRLNPEIDLTGLKHQSRILTSADKRVGMADSDIEGLFAGVYRYDDTVFLEDDEHVSWGVGDEEIIECIKSRLDEHGASDVFSPMYLAINGVAGRNVYRRQGYPDFDEMIAHQIADPSHAMRTKREIELIGSFNDGLLSSTRVGKNILEKINRQSLKASDVEKYDTERTVLSELWRDMLQQAILPEPAMQRGSLPDYYAASSALKYGVLNVADVVKANDERLQDWQDITSGPWVTALKNLNRMEVRKAKEVAN